MISFRKGWLMWAWLLGCAAVQGDDLLEVYQRALLHDPQYAAAQAQRRAGDERRIQGRAGLLPQVSLDAQNSWSETEYDLAVGSIEQRRQNRSYGIQLVQPLFRWQNWIQYEQGNLQQALAIARLTSAEQTLILRVAEAYFEALNADEVLNAVQGLSLASGEQLASAKKNFELGNVSVADVHEAQASFDRAGAQLIKARSERELARHALARIMGRQPGTLKSLRSDMALTLPYPQDLDQWVAAAERSNLEVQVQELLLAVAANDVRSRKAEYLPTVDLLISQTMQQSPNASTERTESGSIGLRFSAPLYSGGRLSSATREAQALRLQAEYELEDARRSAAFATRQAWSGVMDGMAQVKALEAARLSTQSAVESNRLGYRIGMRTGIEVLEAQSQFSDTLQQLARARYDTLLAQLQLKAAVGVLEPNSLVEVNALLVNDDESAAISMNDLGGSVELTL